MIDLTKQGNLVKREKLNKKINIIGCGATGSHVVYTLVKLGFQNIDIYDFDVVEPHNLSNQFYRIEDIGKPKVECLKNIIKTTTNCDINAFNKKIESNTEEPLEGVTFMLVDTMDSRKAIYENCLKLKIKSDLLIETRVGALSGMIYCIDPKNVIHIRNYEKSFYSDEETVKSACGTELMIISTVLATTVYAINLLINYINEEECCNFILFQPNIYFLQNTKF